MQANVKMYSLARLWLLVSLLVALNVRRTSAQFMSSDEMLSLRELDSDPRLYELMKDGPSQQPALLPPNNRISSGQMLIGSPLALPQDLDLNKQDLRELLQSLLVNEMEQQRGQRQLSGYLGSNSQLDISGPVNDPKDSLEIIGKIQAANNESMSLIELADLYLDTIMQRQDLQTGSSQNQDEGEMEVRRQDTDSGEPEQNDIQSGTTSASRYGNGEYIDHPLALVGHQYVQGGAGEGRQLLGPDGVFENKQVIKTDRAVPSYCNPPNPCPKGFTAADGCLEEFTNSASFSREYQIKQKCSCDSEHSLFNCASSSDTLKPDTFSGGKSPNAQDASNDLESDDYLLNQQQNGYQKFDTLARTIQNRFGNLASIKNLIAEHERQSNSHHVVSRRIDA